MLTESKILSYVGEKSFERGREYERHRAIINPKRQGTRLKALCQGSQPEPYRLWVKLGTQIEAASCSCPIGYDGQCKHIAALLLTFLHSPQSFTPIEELDEALARRSKEELIELIKKALEVEPALEGLFELPASS